MCVCVCVCRGDHRLSLYIPPFLTSLSIYILCLFGPNIAKLFDDYMFKIPRRYVVLRDPSQVDTGVLLSWFISVTQSMIL